jgi:hypothetical protein
MECGAPSGAIIGRHELPAVLGIMALPAGDDRFARREDGERADQPLFGCEGNHPIDSRSFLTLVVLGDPPAYPVLCASRMQEQSLESPSELDVATLRGSVDSRLQLEHLPLQPGPGDCVAFLSNWFSRLKEVHPVAHEQTVCDIVGSHEGDIVLSFRANRCTGK